MSEPIITPFADLNFTVEARPEGHYVEYRIFEIAGFYADDQTGDYTVPFYERAGGHSSMDTVDTLADAEPFISGSVKWDGCSNWQFHTEDVMYHGCSREDVQRIGDILAVCWNMTATLCPHWDKEIARG